MLNSDMLKWKKREKMKRRRTLFKFCKKNEVIHNASSVLNDNHQNKTLRKAKTFLSLQNMRKLNCLFFHYLTNLTSFFIK